MLRPILLPTILSKIQQQHAARVLGGQNPRGRPPISLLEADPGAFWHDHAKAPNLHCCCFFLYFCVRGLTMGDLSLSLSYLTFSQEVTTATSV